MSDSANGIARYIMVGGFLGAGKTTAILKLAELLSGQGHKVGLITNDQSVGLVDTTMLGAHDFPVEEITGGCFCCRFQSLTDAAEKLTADEQPDVFLAEPVGSCTDLTATVSYPLRRIYGDAYRIAPYTVLVDPIRAERILGLQPGKLFSPKVLYIYNKQLEEAEIIGVNKIDLFADDPQRLQTLLDTLAERFPQAKVITLSARHGQNIPDWAEQLEVGQLGQTEPMEVDYDTYAEGEALLGWNNLSATLTARNGDFDGNSFVQELAGYVHELFSEAKLEIAHLKMTLSPNEGNDLAVLNLVRSDGSPEFSHSLQDRLEQGELIFNLRAEADPEILKQWSLASVQELAERHKLDCQIDHHEAFRPGRPVPTHRMGPN